MTDTVDQAQKFEELRRKIALKEQAAKPAMPFKGECYNCEAPIAVGCFCDVDCRDDFELREKRK
ncbi:MAG: hypothetical protein WC825_09320 [Gallionellaceae bacterium]|jgi:hypothetical protein